MPRRSAQSRRRLLLLVLVMASAGAATNVFAGVLASDRLSYLDTAILGIFFLSFAWISSAFWTALAGFVVLCRGGGAGLRTPAGGLSAAARTAIVVPVYHEDPEQVGMRIAATYRSLAGTGYLSQFDVFILSDSREHEVVRREQALWARLCAELDARGRLFYRNRADNRGRKAGNIADFCRRWGARYSYFVVLDADSVMSGETVVRLVQLMEANPDAGLIQTVPRPIGGETPLARILQFSASLYGPLLASGLNYWFQDEGNYWGHNAIIRTEAFMANAGLPTLPGAPPFGGEILSHDFVEAAFLRRAGWGVWLVPELGGSYEQLPPTLSEFVSRDRRWCQGNLQHLRLLTIKGLRPASRAHLLTGAMAYLASPLWLTLLVLTSLEAAQGRAHSVGLFRRRHQLRAGLADCPARRAARPVRRHAVHPDAAAVSGVAPCHRRAGAPARLRRRAAADPQRVHRARVLDPAGADPDGPAHAGRDRHDHGLARILERAATARRRGELGWRPAPLWRQRGVRRALGVGGLPDRA